MVLFTKDVFLQLKALNAIYVQVSLNYYPPEPAKEIWQVQISGHADVGNSGAYDSLAFAIQAQTKEDAYRIYKDLMKQVADSGKIPELNEKLFDDVLKGETP